MITFGKSNSLVEKEKHDLKGLEFVPTVVLLGLIISVGVYPNLLGGPLQETIDAMMLALGGDEGWIGTQCFLTIGER